MNRGFTVSELARALAVAPQEMRRRLAGITTAGKCYVAGNEALTYELPALPPTILEGLARSWRVAEEAAGPGARPWRDMAHFIADPPPPGAKASLPTAKQGVGWKPEDFDALEAAVKTLADPARPTAGERAMLLHRAFEAVETAVSDGRPAKKVKVALLRWLSARVPALGCCRRSLNRNLARWRSEGRKMTALMDKRPEVNRKRRTTLAFPKVDQDRHLSAAIKLHGREVAPAWREMVQRSPEDGGFSAEARRGSGEECPRRLRSLMVGRAKELFPFYHQPRKASLNSAYSRRDWSGVAAGDWFSSDDFTLEVYFYTPDGKGWWKLTRGQFLPMICERSLCILDFLLLPEKHYTGANIRTLMNRVGLGFGLPRKGFHFESGIWKQSQLVSGSVPWGDLETSLEKRLGIRISHSLPGNAKAKPVEFVGRLFQRRLRRYPGWAGPNEQVFKVESVQEAKLAVEAGRATPWDAGFKSLTDWKAILETECVSYNHTPQRSRIMGGNRVVRMAPEEAWATLQQDAPPLVNLSGSGAEHLLCSHWVSKRVTRFGIRFTHSGRDLVFCNDATAKLIGQTVKVFFDSECPDMAHIETESGEMFHVPEAGYMPAKDATKADFKRRAATVGAHIKGALGLVSSLPHDFMPPTRRNLPAPELQRRQEAMAAAEADHRKDDGNRARQARRVESLGREVGIAPSTMLDAPNAERGFELLREAGRCADEA